MADITTSRLVSLIGMARRAGFLTFGSDATITAVQKNKTSIALIASNASERTKKQLSDKCISHSVKLVRLPLTCDELAAAAGKLPPLAVVSVTDAGLAGAIGELFAE